MKTHLLVPALLLCLTPAVALAQDDARKEIQELRQRLTEADDRALELARKFDQEKKRLQDEKEALLIEVAKLKKENALLKAKLATQAAGKDEGQPEKKKADAFLDERKVTLNFPETPLEDVGAFLRDLFGLNVVVKSSVPEDAVVTLQVKDLSLRKALDLLCESTRDGEGEACPLMWRFKDGAIQIARKKTKKTR